MQRMSPQSMMLTLLSCLACLYVAGRWVYGSQQALALSSIVPTNSVCRVNLREVVFAGVTRSWLHRILCAASCNASCVDFWAAFMYSPSRWQGLPAAFSSNDGTMYCYGCSCSYAVPLLTLPENLARGPVEGWTPEYARSYCQVLAVPNFDTRRCMQVVEHNERTPLFGEWLIGHDTHCTQSCIVPQALFL